MRGQKTHRRALALVLTGVLTLVAAPSAHAWGGSGWGWSPRGYEDNGRNVHVAPQQPQAPAWQQPTQAAAPQGTGAPAAVTQAATTPASTSRGATSKGTSSKGTSSKTTSSSGTSSKSCVALPKLTSGKASGLTGYVADGKCAAAGIVTLSTSAGKEIARISVDAGDPFRFSLAAGTYRVSVRVSGRGSDDCGGPVKVAKGRVADVACVI